MIMPKKKEIPEISMGLDVMGLNPELRKVQQDYLEHADPDADKMNRLIAQAMIERGKKHG